MMKRRKWLISLVVLGVIMGFSVPKPKAGINGDVSLDSLAVRDTVALPPLSYFTGKTFFTAFQEAGLRTRE